MIIDERASFLASFFASFLSSSSVKFSRKEGTKSCRNENVSSTNTSRQVEVSLAVMPSLKLSSFFFIIFHNTSFGILLEHLNLRWGLFLRAAYLWVFTPLTYFNLYSDSFFVIKSYMHIPVALKAILFRYISEDNSQTCNSHQLNMCICICIYAHMRIQYMCIYHICAYASLVCMSYLLFFFS